MIFPESRKHVCNTKSDGSQLITPGALCYAPAVASPALTEL